ncbi:GAF domain-containing protein [Bradyrhizobium jicamae]|uniref:histidine kinase n=1 Tax=Bradyrhizobium jicamae TaxID=280332 RepID=A0ABS5FVP9_9BRAD|nr:HWE histidine kinase domain-containing protein [Bradyrhizobium jicamae]MBR0800813.1 GAF domain-containing protein [Bradyrhizobium jicamae]MBR0938714.1 GAF domain-containing protein [Bradyrhizobium jicamae]
MDDEPTIESLRRQLFEAETAISERDDLQRTLTDELRTMTRMHGLADRLLAISDLSTGLNEVLDAALGVFDSVRGTVQILDPEAGTLSYAASRGFDEKALAAVPPIDRDFHSTCAVCIRTGGRVVAGDIASDPRWADHASTAAELGYGAALSSPLKTRRDELLGVMTVHFNDPYTPSDRELRWADLFAQSAAHLVERALAEAALRRSREQEILIHELQHRTRNLLTVISGVADQTLAASRSLEEFAPRFEERLAALGRVQGLLSRDIEPNVTVEDLIRLELTARGLDLRGEVVLLEGPKQPLPPAAIQLLALAVHELLTNAVKHGSLRRPEGRLKISWGSVANVDRERLRLDWHESGAALTADASTRGFGLELLESLLPFELDARTTVDFTRDGVHVSVDLPL